MEPKKIEFNCTLVGDFNPAIFHPAWIEKANVFPVSVINKAEIKIVHSQVTQLKISEIDFFIESGIFQASTRDERESDILKDSLIGIFERIEETPIKALGINWSGIFSLETEKKWHSLGHILAPKDLWNKICDQPGMKKLVMKAKNPYEENGCLHFDITSLSLPQSQFGVSVNVNNHFSFEENSTIAVAIPILNKYWSKAQKESRERAEKLLQSF